jgi:hypothetical protein
MDIVLKNNAKLSKLLMILVLLFVFKQNPLAQETDPITEAIQKEKQEYEGMNITTREQKKLDHINSKYAISKREKELRFERDSGQRNVIYKKFRLGRANRKDYLRKKKIDEFNRELILNRQNEATKQRMIENEKRIKKRDKEIKRKQRRKRFFNLFK